MNAFCIFAAKYSAIMSTVIGRKLTMVTTFGTAYGKHSGIVQRQVMMDDLFA